MASISTAIANALASTLASQLTTSTLELTGAGFSTFVGGTITVSSAGTTRAAALGAPLTGTAPNNGTITAFNFGPGKVTGTVGTSNADMILNPVAVTTGQGISITAFEITVETIV